MKRPIEEVPGQISFTSELYRKGTHMGAMVIPASYYWLGLDKGEMLSAMIPTALFMVLIDISRLRQWRFWTGFAAKVGGKLIRGHEQAGDFTGATYILLSVCFTVGLYDKVIAIAALAFIIVGDTAAALIGRKFGRMKFGQKSVEGSLACLAGTLAVAWLVPGLPLAVGITGAVVATLAEALSFGVDDNVSVPILSGLAMTLVAKFLASDAVFA